MTKEVKINLMLKYLDRLNSISSADKHTRTMAVCDAIEAELNIPKTQAKR